MECCPPMGEQGMLTDVQWMFHFSVRLWWPVCDQTFFLPRTQISPFSFNPEFGLNVLVGPWWWFNQRQSKPKPYQKWPVRDDSGTERTVGTTIWTWITTKWAEMTRNHKTGPHKQPNVRIPHVRDQFLDYRTTREPQFDDVMNYDVIDCLTCL